MITTVLIITVSLDKLSAIFTLSIKAFRSYLDQLFFLLHIREWVVYIWGELFHCVQVTEVDQRSKRIFPTNWFYCCSNLKRLHSKQITLSQILDHPLFQYHYFKLHSYLINALIFLFGARLLQRRHTMFFCFEFISQT